MVASQASLPTGERIAKDALKELFKTIGIAPRVSELVDAALERGLIPEEVINSCTRSGLYALCREALKEKESENGLALAKPLGRGRDARWQKVTLMNEAEAISLLQMEYEAVGADIKEFRKYENYFRDRFGDAIPEFKFS